MTMFLGLVCKIAGKPLPYPANSFAGLTDDELIKLRTDAVNRDVWVNAGRFALMGLAAGSGLRGMQGLVGLLQRNRKPAVTPSRVAVLDVPYAKKEEERQKTAGIGDEVFNTLARPFTWVGESLANYGKSQLRGEHATNWEQHPLGYPAVYGAGLASAFGGWKLMDYILDRRRREELAAEKAKAQKEYEQVLLGQHKISHVLDELYAEVFQPEKRANAGEKAQPLSDVYSTPHSAIGQIVGLLLTLGVGAGAVAGHQMYQRALSRSPAALANKAVETYSVNLPPAELFARPVPLPASKLRRYQPSLDNEDQDSSV